MNMTAFILGLFATAHVGVATRNLGDLDDQVSLLQAELLASKADKQDSFTIGEDEDSSCRLSGEGFPRPKTPCAESRKEDKAALFQTDVVIPPEPPLFATTPPQADATEAKEAAASTARYILDVLIFLVVCDGVRRWHNKDKKAPASKAQASKPNACVDGWQGFMKAALDGDAQRCEMLLVDGVDPFRTDVWGCTVLHAAARGGLTSVVKTLLEQGAKIDATDAWDEMPLHVAARAGHTDVCMLLLEKGAPADSINAQDWTPLVVSAHEGKEETCRALLDRGAGAGDLAEKDIPPMLNSLLLQKVIVGACHRPSEKTDQKDDIAAMEQEALCREREEFIEQLSYDD